MSRNESTSPWQVQQAAAMRRMHERGGIPGIAGSDQLSGRSGREILEAMQEGELPYPPMNRTMNMTLIEVAHGVAVFQGVPLPEHYNPHGSVHGGWFATLLDSALGCAIQSVLSVGQTYTTTDLNISIIRRAFERTGPLRATASLIHGGSRVATAEARVEDERGELYAHGTTTCFVFAPTLAEPATEDRRRHKPYSPW